MNQKTKKLPVSLGPEGRPTSDSEFLIPRLADSGRNTFIGIESGKEDNFGAVSFIGMAIDATEVLSKLRTKPENPGKAIKLLDDYLAQLQKFKIGTVVSITYERNGLFSLKKEAERTIKNGV